MCYVYLWRCSKWAGLEKCTLVKTRRESSPFLSRLLSLNPEKGICSVRFIFRVIMLSSVQDISGPWRLCWNLYIFVRDLFCIHPGDRYLCNSSFHINVNSGRYGSWYWVHVLYCLELICSRTRLFMHFTLEH